MFLKIDEDKLKEIEKLTMTDYEAKLGYIPAENIEAIIDDLLCEIHNLQEKISDMEEDIEENYRPIKPHEMNGWNYRDFI